MTNEMKEKALQVKQDMDQLFDAGKQAQYDAMCDAFQNSGKRTVYTNGFCYSAWTEETIPLKYDMYPTDFKYAFQGMNTMLNFEKVIKDRGIVFDTSNCTAFNYAFASCGITHVPTLDLTNGTTLDAIFGWNTNLISVRKVILKYDGSQALKYFVQGGTNIEEIYFEGCIGQDINFQWTTKLTLESLVSILTCLMNYDSSGNQWSKTITLSSGSWALLEAQGAVATSPVTGEACTWIEYVNAKCWNRM